MGKLQNAAAELGKRGGASRSPAKIATARENGKLGGRPPKTARKPHKTRAA